MSRSWATFLVESVVGVASVVFVTAFVAPVSSGSPVGVAQLLEAATLLLALGVVGLFDVSLPRGDAIDATVPIAFAAALRIHPLVAVVVIAGAKCAALSIKRSPTAWRNGVSQIARRSVLVSALYWILHVLRPDILGPIASSSLSGKLAVIAGAAIAFVAVDTLLEQVDTSLRSGTPLFALVVGVVRLQGPMLAAEMSTAALAVVLLPTMQPWGALLITVALLLVMRQSFALLLEVRASYTATVDALARSLEAYDPSRRGHAERVAALVAAAGRLLGYQGRRLEDLTYAALFHEVGLIGSDELGEAPQLGSARVLAEVGFLGGALPVLRILDAAGDCGDSLDERDLVGAYLVASFSAVDSRALGTALEEKAIADSIGSRLYSSTRRTVDRAIQRAETMLRVPDLNGEDPLGAD